MSRLFVPFLSLVTLLFGVSCDTEQKKEIVETKQITPIEITKENSLSSGNRSSGDAIQEIYDKLVENNPNLKRLEIDLESLGSNVNTLNQKFEDYDKTSKRYYSSVKYRIASISDSLLKREMEKLISSSLGTYSAKTSTVKSILQQIKNREITINDYHSILKIVLSLSVIEKYQNDNLRDSKSFKIVITVQDTIINQIKGLIPKY